MTGIDNALSAAPRPMGPQHEREVEGVIAALRHLRANPTTEGAQFLLERWDDTFLAQSSAWRAS